MSDADQVFSVFISHKHEDHALALELKNALDGLKPGVVDCFVSGVDITAGMDWRREIRGALTRSHMLVLLFTAPSKNWDWCLYEAGLYTRFDKSETRSVVCLFNSGGASPSPLADLQGIPAEPEKIVPFLTLLCKRTWELSDDWRYGALAPDVTDDHLHGIADQISSAFARAGSTSTYYPCHRIVLSLGETDDVSQGIPESARVLEGPGDTSGYTMSLFNLAGGTGRRTWGELLRAVDATADPWRKELDRNFIDALHERLFPPFESHFRAGDAKHGEERTYSAILYSIVRGPAVGSAPDASELLDRRPRSLTILLHPHAAPITTAKAQQPARAKR